MADDFDSNTRNRLSAVTRRSALRRFAVGGIGAGVVAGLIRGPAGAQSAVSAAATEAAVRRAIATINQALAAGDPSVLDAVFAPDYVNHTPRTSLATGQPFTTDLAGLKASLMELRIIAPDAVILVRDTVASPDKAAVLVTFRGTVDPTVAGLPALDNPRLRVDGVIYVHLDDSRITESWDYDDAAETLGPTAPPVTPTPTPEVTPTPAPPVAEGMARQSRDVRDFNAVSLDGIGTLSLQFGEAESLTVEAEERIIDRIETVVENGTLFIRPARSFRTREPVTYQLTARQLDSIALGGSTQLVADSLSADQFQLVVAGTSQASIQNFSAQALGVRIESSGRAMLAGSVDAQTIEINGTGIYDAANLTSRVASVTVKGTGQAALNVSESLDAVVGGTGRVTYIGDPQVTQDVSGVGSVTKVG